jgi:hypothetical protein
MKKIFGLVVIFVLAGFMGCKESCKNSALYGYVSICLPEVKGMTECHDHPGVQTVIKPYLASGPILGYYLNNETYKQVDKLSEITYQDYFMIYGDYLRENYNATATDLDAMTAELEQTLFRGDNFDQVSSKVEEYYGSITPEKPALIEKYSPHSNVRTMIVLMKYKNGTGETSVVSAVDVILVKNRLVSMAYYISYDGGKSIDKAKETNNAVIKRLMELN